MSLNGVQIVLTLNSLSAISVTCTAKVTKWFSNYSFQDTCPLLLQVPFLKSEALNWIAGSGSAYQTLPAPWQVHRGLEPLFWNQFPDQGSGVGLRTASRHFGRLARAGNSSEWLSPSDLGTCWAPYRRRCRSVGTAISCSSCSVFLLICGTEHLWCHRDHRWHASFCQQRHTLTLPTCLLSDSSYCRTLNCLKIEHSTPSDCAVSKSLMQHWKLKFDENLS